MKLVFEFVRAIAILYQYCTMSPEYCASATLALSARIILKTFILQVQVRKFLRLKAKECTAARLHNRLRTRRRYIVALYLSTTNERVQ
jgi:hypothetical protein